MNQFYLGYIQLQKKKKGAVVQNWTAAWAGGADLPGSSHYQAPSHTFILQAAAPMLDAKNLIIFIHLEYVAPRY